MTTDTSTLLHPLLQQDDVQGLVFDLDGTLVDSAADILGGIRETFRQAGYGEVPDDYFPENLHGTSDGIMRSIMHDMGWKAPADLRDLKELYYVVYARRAHASTRLYPGAAEVLRLCDGRLPMGICTNKIHRNAVQACQALGIESYFRVISGADTWPQAKPSPVPLLETIRELGLQPQYCLYFGDTSVDAECAAAAGVRFVLHASGYGDTALHGLPRVHTFSRWPELLSTSVSDTALS